MPKQSRRDKIKDNIKGKGRGKHPHPGNTPLTAPLTTPQARHMAKTEARSEYGPTIRAAKQEREGSLKREAQIGDWFNELGTQIGAAGAQTDASYGQANAALQAHMAAAQAAAEQSQGQIASQQAATSALTGSDPSLQLPTLQEGAAAANQRQIAGAALAAPIAQAGASQASYLRNTGINARREGIQQKLNEGSRREKIKEDITALRKERAGKAVGNFRDIRGEERDYKIQNRAFPLEKQKLGLEAQEGAADRNLEAAKFGETQRHNRATEGIAAQGNKPGGRTPSERNDIKDARRDARITATNLYSAAKNPPHSAAEWAAFTQLVASEVGSAAAAQVAVRKLRAEVRRREEAAQIKAAEDPSPYGMGR